MHPTNTTTNFSLTTKGIFITSIKSTSSLISIMFPFQISSTSGFKTESIDQQGLQPLELATTIDLQGQIIVDTLLIKLEIDEFNHVEIKLFPNNNYEVKPFPNNYHDPRTQRDQSQVESLLLQPLPILTLETAQPVNAAPPVPILFETPQSINNMACDDAHDHQQRNGWIGNLNIVPPPATHRIFEYAHQSERPPIPIDDLGVISPPATHPIFEYHHQSEITPILFHSPYYETFEHQHHDMMSNAIVNTDDC